MILQHQEKNLSNCDKQTTYKSTEQTRDYETIYFGSTIQDDLSKGDVIVHQALMINIIKATDIIHSGYIYI